ncbi:hypothetical protein [Microvirga antarctica]|uniref:hypothetical protein n=1 Tax=Microvirga antarctica TaxID=2819233 RepID=UPI001B314843|nr:hypothetical protein [Microvirga antarctica]
MIASLVAGGPLASQSMAQTSTMSPGSATPSPGSPPSTVTAPRAAPGTEGSSGSRSPATMGRPGDVSGIRPTARELELRRKSDVIDKKVRRGICVGC